MIARVRVASLAIVAFPGALAAQGLDPSPASQCGVKSTITPLTESAGDSRVLIRFTTDVSSTADEAIFARALGTLTADRIRQAVDVDVRSRGLNGSSNSEGDASSAVAEGRVLGVRFVLVGTVQSIDDRYLVSYRLVDARSGKEMTNGSISQPVVAVDSLVGAMTSTLTRAFGRPTYRPPPQDRIETTSPTALLAYLRALTIVETFDRARLAEAEQLLRESIENDPRFTAARFRLADVLLRQLDWVEQRDRERARLVRDGLWNVGFALLRDPYSTRALSLLGRLHLHGASPQLTQHVVTALERLAPGTADAVMLSAQMERALGNDSTALTHVRTLAAATERSPTALAIRADLERRVGDPVTACRVLNRAVALDPLFTPAYVWRALVRSGLGERREAWADAEVASRLGRADWGELTGALIDLSMRDTLRAKNRLQAHMGGESLAQAGWLDLLLRAGVAHGLQKPALAQQALRLVPCSDPRRPQLEREPLLKFLKVPTECSGQRVAAR